MRGRRHPGDIKHLQKHLAGGQRIAVRGGGQLLDMHLSPLVSTELLGWSLPARRQRLWFFHTSRCCQQMCRSGRARALPKGSAQLSLLVDTSQLAEASLEVCLVVPGLGCSVVPGCQSPQGLTGAGTKVFLSLPYGQSFSTGEYHCDSTGTSLRVTPQPRTQPFLQETPPHARTVTLQGHQAPPAN